MSCTCGPGNYPLCIYQGATVSLVFLWTAGNCCGAVGASPQPVDLTGYTAAMQIRPYVLSPTVLYDAGAAGDLVLGGVYGTITLTIDATDTEGFTWWTGVYDLLVTSSGGVVTPLLKGTVTVSPSVTS
jgi:hypothetical protein